MRLEIIQSIQFVIIAFLAYVPSVVLSGWFEAWVSKKCGDDTPEQFGFLTFNPFAHFSVFGFGVLLAGRLLGDYLPFLQGIPAWGRYIPVSPSEFDKKQAIVQFHARGFAYFILTLVSFVILTESMKLGYLNKYWMVSDMSSSAVASVLQVVQFFNSLNFNLAVIYLAIGSFRSAIFYKWSNFYAFFEERFFLGMLLMMVFVMISAKVFEIVITTILMLIFYMIAG